MRSGKNLSREDHPPAAAGDKAGCTSCTDPGYAAAFTLTKSAVFTFNFMARFTSH